MLVSPFSLTGSGLAAPVVGVRLLFPYHNKNLVLSAATRAVVHPFYNESVLACNNALHIPRTPTVVLVNPKITERKSGGSSHIEIRLCVMKWSTGMQHNNDRWGVDIPCMGTGGSR